MKILVNSLIISKLEYNLEILYNLPQNSLEKLEKMLRKCVRLIFKLRKRENVDNYMKQLNWLPISERIKYKSLILIHNSIINKTPIYINSLFQINEREIFQTRQTTMNNINIIKPISELHRRAISVYGPQIYNSIPFVIRQSKNFKEKLKIHLLQEYYKDQ